MTCLNAIQPCVTHVTESAAQRIRGLPSWLNRVRADWVRLLEGRTHALRFNDFVVLRYFANAMHISEDNPLRVPVLDHDNPRRDLPNNQLDSEQDHGVSDEEASQSRTQLSEQAQSFFSENRDEAATHGTASLNSSMSSGHVTGGQTANDLTCPNVSALCIPCLRLSLPYRTCRLSAPGGYVMQARRAGTPNRWKLTGRLYTAGQRCRGMLRARRLLYLCKHVRVHGACRQSEV